MLALYETELTRKMGPLLGVITSSPEQVIETVLLLCFYQRLSLAYLHLADTDLLSGPSSSAPFFQRVDWGDLYHREMKETCKNEIPTILLVGL